LAGPLVPETSIRRSSRSIVLTRCSIVSSPTFTRTMSPSSIRSTSTGSMATRLPLGMTGSMELPSARKRPVIPSFTFHSATGNIRGAYDRRQGHPLEDRDSADDGELGRAGAGTAAAAASGNVAPSIWPPCADGPLPLRGPFAYFRLKRVASALRREDTGGKGPRRPLTQPAAGR